MTAITLRLAYGVTALFTAIISRKSFAVTRWMSAFFCLFRVAHVNFSFPQFAAMKAVS
jgi:hypothetical protein